MNLAAHQNLWTSIQQFAFDEPNATITFSKKLADQQNWSALYTQRVIEEYRRFIFLCCISPKGASPSKAVDEVWHLHLTYTKSYWEVFCKNTLGRDIHHYPSNGGEKEDHKHANWYDETLKLYESVFEERPPFDIWPRPVKQWQPLEQPRVEPHQYIISKQMLLIVALLLLLPLALSYATTGIASPFSLKGSQFLLSYAMFCVATLIAHYLVRRDRVMAMKKIVDGYPIRNINIFQLTNSVYGKHRALQTCLIDLHRRNLVSVDDNGKIVVYPNKYQEPEKEENPLVPALLVSEDGSLVDYTTIEDHWYKKKSFEHPAITQLYGLAWQKESIFQKSWVIQIALLLGFGRVFQGLMNDRPVLFLLLEIIALLIGAWIIYEKFTTEVLAYKRLKELLFEKAGSRQMHNDDVVNDYALNGPTILDTLPATLMLGSMVALFAVPPLARRTADSNDGDNSWGVDGVESSCSGGDSSCGGGGCGGCGGGGD